MTDKLYSEGNNRIEITKDTVKRSYQGKNAVEEILSSITKVEQEIRDIIEILINQKHHRGV